MKKRMLGMLTAAVLLVGILGVAMATHAQGPAPVPSAAPAPGPALTQSAFGTPQGVGEKEVTKGPDTDQIEEQLEEQSGTQAEDSKQNAGPDEAQPAYTGSVKVGDPEPADLGKLATITVDQAKAAALTANAGATVVKAELDNENGYLVYSVQLSNGADVKIDAATAKVLHTEQPGADDGQEATGGEGAAAEEAGAGESR